MWFVEFLSIQCFLFHFFCQMHFLRKSACAEEGFTLQTLFSRSGITPLSGDGLLTTTDVMTSANDRWCHDVLTPLSGDVTRRHLNECKPKCVYSASEMKFDYYHYVRCTLTGTKFLSVQVTVPRKTWRDREEEHKIGPSVLIYRYRFSVRSTF